MMNKKLVFLIFIFTGFFGCYRPAIPWKITAHSIVENGDGIKVALNWKGGPNGTPVNTTVVYEFSQLGGDAQWTPIAKTEKWKNVQSLDFSKDGKSLILAADVKARDIWLWEIDKLPVEFTSNKDVEGDVIFVEDLIVFRKKEGKAHNIFSKSINGIQGKRLTNDTSVRWNLKVFRSGEELILIHNVLNGMNLGISSVSLRGTNSERILDNPGPEVSFDVAEGKVFFSNENKWFLCETGLKPWEEGCEEKEISSEFSWTGDVFVLNQDVYGGVVAESSSPRQSSLLYSFLGKMLSISYENGDIKSLKSEGDVLGLVVNNPATGDFFRIEKFGNSSFESLPPIYPPELED